MELSDGTVINPNCVVHLISHEGKNRIDFVNKSVMYITDKEMVALKHIILDGWTYRETQRCMTH